MGLASEFKEFAMKGSVVDLAIGGVDFKDLAAQIGSSPKGEPVLFKYGMFIQTVFEFLIIALALFMVIKAINRLKRPNAAMPVPPTKTEALLQEIRDQLAKR